jgi:hypothetical protein
MSEGWICLHGKIRESAVFQDAELLKLWLLCLLSANHADAWVKVDRLAEPVLVKRGQFITGRYALHAAYYPKKKQSNKSASAVWRWLETLQKMGNFRVKTNSRFSLITIVNYERYQGLATENEQQVNSRRTAGEQQTRTNNKEDHENKSARSPFYRTNQRTGGGVLCGGGPTGEPSSLPESLQGQRLAHGCEHGALLEVGREGVGQA